MRHWYDRRFFWWLVHTAALLPLLWLGLDNFNKRLTANPVQAAMQRSGDAALILLLLSLACTPLAAYLGWRFALKLRRPLGLYAFLYALVHFLLFAWADYAWQFDFMLPEIAQKRYLWVGLPAFAILLLLALLSNRTAAALAGTWWKRLQRLAYPAAVLAVLHVAWAVKGDLLHFSGDIWKPFLAAVFLTVLLLARLPLIGRSKVSSGGAGGAATRKKEVFDSEAGHG